MPRVDFAAGGLGRGTAAAPAVEAEAAAVADEVAGVWAGAPPAWAREDAAARISCRERGSPAADGSRVADNGFLAGWRPEPRVV